MKRSRSIALVAAFASPAAAESLSETPYGQVRTAVEGMEGLITDLDEKIERRRNRNRGKAVECLQDHRASIASLRDLSSIQRARLVEAMADGEPLVVEEAHRNVMLWHIKARVHHDAVGACPSQSEYDLAKSIAEIEALAKD